MESAELALLNIYVRQHSCLCASASANWYVSSLRVILSVCSWRMDRQRSLIAR